MEYIRQNRRPLSVILNFWRQNRSKEINLGQRDIEQYTKDCITYYMTSTYIFENSKKKKCHFIVKKKPNGSCFFGYSLINENIFLEKDHHRAHPIFESKVELEDISNVEFFELKNILCVESKFGNKMWSFFMDSQELSEKWKKMIFTLKEEEEKRMRNLSEIQENIESIFYQEDGRLKQEIKLGKENIRLKMNQIGSQILEKNKKIEQQQIELESLREIIETQSRQLEEQRQFYVKQINSINFSLLDLQKQNGCLREREKNIEDKIEFTKQKQIKYNLMIAELQEDNYKLSKQIKQVVIDRDTLEKHYNLLRIQNQDLQNQYLLEIKKSQKWKEEFEGKFEECVSLNEIVQQYLRQKQALSEQLSSFRQRKTNQSSKQNDMKQSMFLIQINGHRNSFIQEEKIPESSIQNPSLIHKEQNMKRNQMLLSEEKVECFKYFIELMKKQSNTIKLLNMYIKVQKEDIESLRQVDKKG